MNHAFTYHACLAASARVSWQIEDILGGDKRLDFERPFLPESLARASGLDFLSADERRCLNHIRAHGYLCTFGLVEEFILPFVLDHARSNLEGDDLRTRALLQFATEEAKHIHLFKTFRAEFEHGFGHPCEVIGPPEAVARTVLAHGPLSVALTILHIEWMTQRHYVDSVRTDEDLDPQFKSLLRHHWLEEAQHAKLDALMVEHLAASLRPHDVEASIDEYLRIGGALGGLLAEQAAMDLRSLERATGRSLTSDERARVFETQYGALRWTFLGSGMTHPKFVATLATLSPSGAARVRDASPSFC